MLRRSGGDASSSRPTPLSSRSPRPLLAGALALSVVCVVPESRAAGGPSGFDDPLDVPSYDLVPADLVVRPDALVVDVTVRCANVECLQQVSGALGARLKEVAGKGELRLREFVASRAEGSKGSRWEPEAWQVDATFEVPLAESQDFWARARLLVAMHKVVAELGKAYLADKSGAGVSFNPPRLMVRDPERFREQLLTRWVQRARQLGSLAQAAKAPLVLRDCLPPAAIEQRLRTIDEVALSLQLSCRLDLPGNP